MTRKNSWTTLGISCAAACLAAGMLYEIGGYAINNLALILTCAALIHIGLAIFVLVLYLALNQIYTRILTHGFEKNLSVPKVIVHLPMVAQFFVLFAGALMAVAFVIGLFC